MAKWLVTYQIGSVFDLKMRQTEIEADRLEFGKNDGGVLGTFFFRDDTVIAFFKNGTLNHYELISGTESEGIDDLRAMWGGKERGK